MKSIKEITTSDKAAIKSAIGRAEKQTSGEVRVFLEDASEDGPLDRAAYLFGELGMSKTALHNGVLIYVALKDHKFAIIGDKGIHEKVGDNFWDEIKEKMQSQFKSGSIIEGIVEAVHRSGSALATHFPYAGNDRNELSDDVIFGTDKP